MNNSFDSNEDANNNHRHEAESDFNLNDAYTNGRRAFAELGRYLEEDGWYPQQLDERTVYRMSYKGRSASFFCYAQVRVDAEQLICYAASPVQIAEDMRSAAVEYLTRANWGLYIGNFEMDYSDGEVRFKSSIDFEGESLTSNLIRNTIYPAAQLMDRYLPGLMKVAFGNVEPRAAIEEVEGD